MEQEGYDLDILEYIPDIKGNPQAMEGTAELMAKLPEMEIDGSIHGRTHFLVP